MHKTEKNEHIKICFEKSYNSYYKNKGLVWIHWNDKLHANMQNYYHWGTLKRTFTQKYLNYCSFVHRHAIQDVHLKLLNSHKMIFNSYLHFKSQKTHFTGKTKSIPTAPDNALCFSKQNDQSVKENEHYLQASFLLQYDNQTVV